MQGGGGGGGRGGGGRFRSYLLADARWSERRRWPTTEVLERRASGWSADGDSTTDLPETK